MDARWSRLIRGIWKKICKYFRISVNFYGNSENEIGDDDIEEKAKNKFKPEWARGASIKEALSKQYGLVDLSGGNLLPSGTS